MTPVRRPLGPLREHGTTSVGAIHLLLILLLDYLLSNLSESLVFGVLVLVLETFTGHLFYAERLTVYFFSKSAVIESVVLCAHNLNDCFIS